MILCIDKNSIRTSHKVQKDIKLEELLLHHTKYFDSEESALKEEYVPLHFCTSVRSMYDNKVLQNTTKLGTKLYYMNITDIEELPHRGYDLVMYLSSVALMKQFNLDSQTAQRILFQQSQFTPMGLFNISPDIIHPMVYSHVILTDDGARMLESFLKENARFVTIDYMRNNHDGNVDALLDTLVEVKKEVKDNEQ